MTKSKRSPWNKNISQEELNRMLETVQVIENKYPEPATILPEPFCPKCGCSHSRRFDHEEVTYPDQYTEFFCSKCGFKVAVIDNSPYIHCLEYKDEEYRLG